MILDLVAVALAALALLGSVVALRRLGASRRRVGAEALPEDVHGLRQEVAALRAEARDALRHLAVVRYDAFGDMGGHLSWSLALLDDGGNGVVLTSIHGRARHARTPRTSPAGAASSSSPPRRRRRSPPRVPRPGSCGPGGNLVPGPASVEV